MKYVVEIGNGYKVVGPFNTKSEAQAYVEEHQFTPSWTGFSFNIHILHAPVAVPSMTIEITGRLAYVAIVNADGYTLGVCEEGKDGYFTLKSPPTFDSYEAASAYADERNLNELGLDKTEAVKITISTMSFGRKGRR